MCKIAISSCVVPLLFFCCPPAVCRPAILKAFFTLPARVMTIIINAINRMVGTWTWLHVDIKSLKRMTPSGTDLNPTTSVIWIDRIIRVGTSSYYSSPYYMFSSVRPPVRGALFNNSFSNQTAAAFYLSIAEYNSYCYAHLSTIAPAPPLSLSSFCVPCSFNNKQPMKSLVSQVYKITTSFVRKNISHALSVPFIESLARAGKVQRTSFLLVSKYPSFPRLSSLGTF